MITPVLHVQGDALRKALNEVVADLEVCLCAGRPPDRVLELRKAAQRLVTLLDASLQEQEDTYLRGLRQEAAEAEAGEVRRLYEEHDAIRAEAGRLLAMISENDLGGASETARTLLSVLYRHVGHQADMDARRAWKYEKAEGEGRAHPFDPPLCGC